LDLFAGTGNISYEFASRGCDNVIAVDGDFGCIKFIKQTADEFDFTITAIKSDVMKFLEKNSNSYDIIFADPPYAFDQETFEKIVKTVFERELLQEDGMMIIEHSKYTKMAELSNFSFQKAYGGSFFSFFELNKNNEEEVDGLEEQEG
jgi:16S rRNA (guanine(966)-N(2))-methyltransferase RsmD